MKKRNLVILQARMSSSRLPGKVLLEINQMPMIYWQIQRLLQAKSAINLIVATSIDPSDDILSDFLTSKNLLVHRGDLTNVYLRFLEISGNFEHDAIIRITGDCPLIMPEILDDMLSMFYDSDVDYLSNTLNPTFPDGLDIEIFKKGVINRLSTFVLTDQEKEHVTLGIYTRASQFTLLNYSNSMDLSNQRWTVDYREDFDFVCEVYSFFEGRESVFGFKEVLDFLAQNPEIVSTGRFYKRNELH